MQTINRLFIKCISILFLIISYNPAVEFLTVLPNQDAFSQEIEDSYKLRSDQFDPRKEGIKEYKEKPVTGDKIVLLSALINTNISDVAPIPDVIQLAFYAEQRTPASVEVFHEPKLYYVDPVWEDWGPGIASFKWPTDIIKRHDIPPDMLFARAVSIKQAKRIMYPVCLYFGDLPGAVLEYRFIVTPLRKMKMQFWIIESGSDDPIVTGTEQIVNANKHLSITWNCLDDAGKVVPEGEYILKLQGTYKPRFGKKRTVPINYLFFHKGNFTE